MLTPRVQWVKHASESLERAAILIAIIRHAKLHARIASRRVCVRIACRKVLFLDSVNH